VRLAKAAGTAAAAVLLAGAGGCDYWNNLVEEKTAARADLEVKVIDAWTGEPLAGAACRDSLRGASATADDQGVFRIEGASTGQYEFTCGHPWYFDGAAKAHLTKNGAHAIVKLARKGLSDWYRDSSRTVAIPLPRNGSVRIPLDLDWGATPWDTTGKFRYEWTFLHSPRLNLGQSRGDEPLDPKAYSPRFRRRASQDMGIQAGPDTAILKVYSLLDGSRSGYLVGSDTVPFEWVQNRKPYIRFLDQWKSEVRQYKVGCANELPSPPIVGLKAGDSDGVCASLRFRSLSAPSLSIDTPMACVASPNYVYRVPLRFQRPSVPGEQNEIGQYVYDNTFIAEITDDNGEKAWDTLLIQTKTNAAPKVVTARLPSGRASYLQSEPVTFEVKGKDTDGPIKRLELSWTGDSGVGGFDVWENPDPAFGDSLGYRFTESFSQPGVVTWQARVIDACNDTGSMDGTSLFIRQNHPPTIHVSNFTSSRSPSGDSLRVHVAFLLTVKDEDATLGDSLTSVGVYWGNDGYQADSAPAARLPFEHTFSPGRQDTVLVKILAYDALSSQSDTTFQIYP
jgi:hypothetical protein